MKKATPATSFPVSQAVAGNMECKWLWKFHVRMRKIPKGTSSIQIKNDLSAFLLMHYGQNSPYRKPAFLQAECYSMLEEEGILRTKYDAQTARSFTVEIVRGPREPTQLSGFIFLEQIEFDITNF